MTGPDANEAIDAQALRRAFALLPALVAPLLALHLVPGDDALRHVAIAFLGGRRWGDVYPFSEFARFPDYDPWWGYDAALRALHAVVVPLPIDRLAAQFLVLKLLSALLVGVALWLMARRSRIGAAIVDPRTFLLAVVVTALALAMPLQRMASARPFVFGTLFLVYAVGRTGAVHGFLAAALLTALYPYLAWIYLLAAAAAHLWRGSRAFALGAIAAALAGAAFRPADFAGFVTALAHSGAVRAEVAAAFRITELTPLWQHPYTVALAVLAAWWLVPRLPGNARGLRTEHVMALCFLPVSALFARYFVDVVIPLLFVAHAADAVGAAQAPVARIAARLRGGASDAGTATATSSRRSLLLSALLVVALAAVVGALGVRSLHQHEHLARVADNLAPIPRGSLVLTQFNLQYRILYARPDLSLVPSSELGFPLPEIHDAYVAYVAHGRACALARRIGAAYLVDTPSHRLDTGDRACLHPLRAVGDLRLWRVAP